MVFFVVFGHLVALSANCSDFESHYFTKWEEHISVIRSYLIGLYCIYFPLIRG